MPALGKINGDQSGTAEDGSKGKMMAMFEMGRLL